jgi:hypothetical protein
MRVVSVPRLSSLERFACSFHQDFALEFPDVQSGGAIRIEQLSPAQRKLLHGELAIFLASHENSSEKALSRAWTKLGAHYWPRRSDTKSILTGFLNQLEKKKDL